MFESLTKYIEEFNIESFGEVPNIQLDEEDDGKTAVFSHASYEPIVYKFMDDVYDFNDTHNPIPNNDYMKVIEEYAAGDIDKLKGLDTSDMDSTVAFAYILMVIRGERFCDGLLLRNLEDGTIIKWLNRLKEIDENSK